MSDIYVMQDESGGEILVTPLSPGGTSRENLGAIWDRLEGLRQHGYETCSECSRAVESDPRGDVLDSSGRCDECRP